MAVTQKVTLYNNKFTVPPVINAVQNDTDRQVEAYFGDFTLQVGMTGKLSFIRSDGTHYEVSATLSTANNTATAELDQALTQAGVTQAQLKITDSGNVGSTFTFMIKVQPDVAGISVPQDGWSAQEFDQRLTDVENAIDAVEEDVADLQDKEYDYAPVITDTATGAIASFSDGADSYPLKGCVVDVDAVQDLHGYDSPWPAGGGKNLLKNNVSTQTNNGVTFTVNSDGSVNVNGTASGGDADFEINTTDILPDGTYILNGCPSGGSAYSYYLRSTRGISGVDFGSGSVNLVYTSGAALYVYIHVANGTSVSNVLFKPMIRLASETDATFAPYSNICPISGFSTAKVTRTGINVWDEEWTNGKFDLSTGNPISDSTTIRSKNGISVVGNTDYYVKNSGISSQSAMIAFWYDLNNSFIHYDYCGNKVVTSPADAKYMQFYCGSAYGDTYNNDISISYPSTDHDYHKGEVQTVTIDLGDTRYGGTLDVTTGKLTVTHRRVTYNGQEAWTGAGNSEGFYTQVNYLIKLSDYSDNIICDRLKTFSNNLNSSYRNAEMGITGFIDMLDRYPNQNWFYAKTVGVTTAEEFKAWLADNPITVVYELATPIEVDLTPTEITTLLGLNNIFADCGNVSVTYGADTKLFIQKLISALA